MLSLMIAAAVAATSADTDLQSVLRAKDQALLDAIAPGQRQVWNRALTPDAVYVDENGEIIPRAKFLDELKPLPSYASGQLKIVDYSVTRDGDTAMVIHRDSEDEVFYGHALHADYLTTETWVRRGGNWRLAMVHAYVVAKDPPSITLPAGTLDRYVGRYQLAPGVVYAVRREGDHLIAGTEGKPAKPLLAEAADVFFTPSAPRTRKLFVAPAGGRATRIIDRREGEDLVYERIGEAQ